MTEESCSDRTALSARLREIEAELRRFAKIKELYNLDFDLVAARLKLTAQDLRIRLSEERASSCA